MSVTGIVIPDCGDSISVTVIGILDAEVSNSVTVIDNSVVAISIIGRSTGRTLSTESALCV